VEDKDVDKSDARTGFLKSHSEDDSYDYGDEHYNSRKTKKNYVPVFVPEAEKKKSTPCVFCLQVSGVAVIV